MAKIPEWDGLTNKYEWILDAAIRLREERKNGHRPVVPELRLYVSGRLVELPKVALPRRSPYPSATRLGAQDVARIDQQTQPAHPAGSQEGAEKAS